MAKRRKPSLYERINDMIIREPDLFRVPQLQRIFRTKSGDVRVHYTREQFAEVDYWFGELSRRRTVNWQIINNFKNMENWNAGRSQYGKNVERLVNNFVNEVTSQEGGVEALAEALEEAANEGLLKEMQVYAYDGTVEVFLADFSDKFLSRKLANKIPDAESAAREADDVMANSDNLESGYSFPEDAEEYARGYK